MDKIPIIEREELYTLLDESFKQKKIVFIIAATGHGKTTAALQWAKRQKRSYSCISADDDDIYEKIENNTKQLLIIDNFQQLYNDASARMCIPNLLNNLDAEKRVLILCRGEIPDYLRSFKVTGQIAEIDCKQLAFSFNEAYHLLSKVAPNLTADEITAIYEYSGGHILTLVNIAARLQNGSPATEETMKSVSYDLYLYYNNSIFSGYDSEIQRTLMYLAPFDSFSLKLAISVTGNNFVEEVLDKISMLDGFFYDGHTDVYTFVEIFRTFLRKRLKKSCSEVFIRNIYHNAGLYYELNNDLKNAFENYKKEGNTEKLSELLIVNSRYKIATSQFYDLEEYYYELPEEVVLSSPELMNGMVILCYLRFKQDEGLMWKKRLNDYVKSLNKNDARYANAAIVKACNDIVVPIDNPDSTYIDKLKSFAALARHKVPIMEQLSATSNSPSIMNGGIDFCTWSKNDKLYYRTLKSMLLLVLKNSAGLAEISLGESLMEKTSDTVFSEAMPYLNTGLLDARSHGANDIAFAGTAILARIYAAQGSLSLAKNNLKSFYDSQPQNENKSVLLHINAFRIWLSMLENDVTAVQKWLKNETPDENEDFRLMDRYIYMVKLRAYLMMGKYTEGFALAYKLISYFEQYNRTYYLAQARLLLATYLYRTKNAEWENQLKLCLETTSQFGFYRIVADEGIIALELLKKYSGDCNTHYMKKLIEAVRAQALLYPSYLKAFNMENVQFTKKQLDVIRLMANGLNNNDMADILNVSENTIRTHIKTIFSKLDVNSRLQAVQKAEQMGIISKG